MASLTELERQRDKALQTCKAAKEKMKLLVDDPKALARIAQEANDAWLEYKHKDTEFNNCLVHKRMGDLYGC